MQMRACAVVALLVVFCSDWSYAFIWGRRGGGSSCYWRIWGEWGPCSMTCGGGTRLRSRSYSCGSVKHGTEACQEICVNGGTYNGNNQPQRCNCPPEYWGTCCVKGFFVVNSFIYSAPSYHSSYTPSCDCGWNAWSICSPCSRPCAGGTRTRTRALISRSCLTTCGKTTSDLFEHGRCNEKCSNGGLYLHMRCQCPDEFYGKCCRSVCPSIPHCTSVQCSSTADNKCTKCDDEGSTIDQSIYFHTADRKACQATCSWKQHQCWPGTCSDHLPHTCQCERGFKADSITATCDINTKPDLLRCNLEITDKNSDKRQTQHQGNSTGCGSQIDVFVNIRPVSLTYNIDAHFTRVGKTPQPNYIPPNSTKLGIVKGEITLQHVNIAGTKSFIKTTKLYGGGDCNSTMGSSTPAINLKCDQTIPVITTTEIKNGDRICADISIYSGGSFSTIDYNGYTQKRHDFTPLPQKKTLCFKYDDAPPVHCSSSSPSPCSLQPLQLSHRLTRSPNITATIAGWTDPAPPHGQTSGIDFYLLELHKMKKLGQDAQSVESSTVWTSGNLIDGNVTVTIPFTTGPMMYAVSLEVHDVAGNVEYARRYFLYDNTSEIDIRDTAEIRVDSASKQTDNEWQIHHCTVKISWTDYFHNDDLAQFMFKLGGHGNPKAIYDQQTGVLAINGTTNINGITGFQYSWALDSGSRSPWRVVPDFTNENLTLALNVSDGETFQVWIQAEDIMNNTREDSVIFHVDRSVARISDTWLVRDGTSKVYVHNSTDLSKMHLHFQAFDEHSGLSSVQWVIGIENNVTELLNLGKGTLRIVRLKAGENCPPQDKENCYCPLIGLCEYKNYTISLNSLRLSNKTINGQHNREYYFTLHVTNGAKLKSFDHIDVLVDASAPEVGRVQEGVAGSPDIDFTNEKHVTVSWMGFVDHESGIHHYVAGLSERCFTSEEMLTGNNASIKISHVESLTFPVNHSGKYFSSVIALNNALEPSDVICSDGIVLDNTPPLIYDIDLHRATVKPSLQCTSSGVWLVNRNLTMTPLSPTPTCSMKCDTQENGLLFHTTNVTLNDDETVNNLCRQLDHLNNSIIYIPFDRIHLKWNIRDDESQIKDTYIGIGSDNTKSLTPDLLQYTPTHGKEDFRMHRTGFGGSTEFYIFIKTVNKASLESLSTIGPVMIDDTPPTVHGTLKPRVVGDHVVVSWNKTTFSDPEQDERNFTVTYRAVMNEQYVTPILETHNTMKDQCKLDGFDDCVRYPLSRLQLQDSELGLPCLFELYVYNQAGHFTTVRTESILLPSRFPPGPATVLDLDPDNIDQFIDVNFQRNSTVCVHWYGFHHHKNVSLEIGVGSVPNSDDVVAFKKVDDIDLGKTCTNTGSLLKPFQRFFTSIRASCSGGSSIASSDGFVIVTDIPNSLTVNDGLGCHPSQQCLLEQLTTDQKNVQFERSLPVGKLYRITVEHVSKADNLTLTSDDIVINTTSTDDDVTIITFFPLKSHPYFSVQTKNGHNLAISLYDCVSDIDYQSSRDAFSINWKIAEPYSDFVTNFKLEVFEKRCADESRDNCLTLLQGTVILVSNKTFHTFSNTNMRDDVNYIGSVSPCFEGICLSPVKSDGIHIVGKPIIGGFQSMIAEETSACTNISLDISSIQCPEGERVPLSAVQLAIHRSRDDMLPVTPWERIHLSPDFKDSTCIKIPVYTFQKMYSCLRVFCPSGSNENRCVRMTLNPHVETYNKHNLFEFPAYDGRLTRVQDLIHSQRLGTNLRLLHEMDLDFVNVSTRISAAITNSAGHNITWYMMKGKREIPYVDCDTDDSCVASKTTGTGIVRFGKIDYDLTEQYFVCADAMKEDGDSEWRGCGNGFVVDDDPPIPGSVSVTNAVSGFLTDSTQLEISWWGFRDVLPKQAIAYGEGIRSYSIAVGTFPGGNDILGWTSVGDSKSHVASGLSITNGETYYATVKAEDHVGHVTESVSSGVVADLTAPVCGDIQMKGLLSYRHSLSGRVLHVHLNNINDPESDVSSLHIRVLSSIHTDTSHLTLAPDTQFVDVDVDDGFVDGHRYSVQVQVMNKAGIQTTCMSPSFILDNSPPRAGTVRDNAHQEMSESDHQTESTQLSVHWEGFTDPHTDIHNYRVGLGTSSHKTDVQPLVSVGLRTDHIWKMTFLPGVKYFSHVEACNGGGLCTTVTSDGIIMDGSPPVAGVVIVGHTDTHHKFHGHRSYVHSHWVGFEDAETGIHHFECCIGLSTNSCDIVNFTNTALSDSYLASGLDLPLSVPLYVTVRAYNPVGLFVESTSPSFTVDDTPPQVVSTPLFISSDGRENITSQWENSLLFIKWEFSDDDSPIHEHVLTFRTHHESSVAIETVKLGPQLSHLLVLGKDNRMQNGDRYQVSVSSCNRAGLCTIAQSPDILIDSTPPFLGGFKPPMTWQTKHSSSINEVTLRWYGFSDAESGLYRYLLSVGSTYEGAEFTDGHIPIQHDGTKSEQTTTLKLKRRISSGNVIILSIYAENNVGLVSSIGKVTVIPLDTNTTGNGGGTLELQRHSCDIHYCTGDCTCAVVGKTCEQLTPSLNCTQSPGSPIISVHAGTPSQSAISTIPSLSCIAGHWKTRGNSSEGILRYEWSMGLVGQQPGGGVFDKDCSIWYDVGKQTDVVYCVPCDRTLEHGQRYLIYVRAWYSRTEYSISTSEEILVDHTPPVVRRGRGIKESDVTCEEDFDIFHSNQTEVFACWKGSFQESQTSIKEYFVWAGTTKYGTDLLSRRNVGLTTNISLQVDHIQPGTKYYVGVCAVNTLNMSTTAISDGFLLDADKPVGGHVFNSARHRNRIAQSDNTTIGVSWHGFQDHHSHIGQYHVEVFDEGSSSSVIKTNATLWNAMTFGGIQLEHGHRYLAAVTAEDSAGHKGRTVYSPPLLVDTSQPVGFICLAFEEILPVNLLHETLNVSSHVVHHISLDLPVNGSDIFRIIVAVEANREVNSKLVVFSVGNLQAEAPFVIQDIHDLYAAEYQFTRETKNDQVEISFKSTSDGFTPDVKLEVCSKTEVILDSRAVTTKQLTPSLLCICARVMDPESGLKDILIGVGTTPGGYQVQTLRPSVARFHEMLEVNLPHGTPVYTTVIAENHAGLKTIFHSDPIVIDHTPPSVEDVVSELKYVDIDQVTQIPDLFNNTDGDVANDTIQEPLDISNDTETNREFNDTNAKLNETGTDAYVLSNSEIPEFTETVLVEARWMVDEKVSNVISCWCSLGYPNALSDTHPWILATNNMCQLPVTKATHGLRVHLDVQCINSVGLVGLASSQQHQVALRAPSSNDSNVDVLIQNSYSEHGREIVQSSSSSVKFQWVWSDIDTVSHYQCRADGEGMIGWINSSVPYCQLTDLDLVSEERYSVEVRAVDERELVSDGVSATLVVDDTAPTLTGSPAEVTWSKMQVTLDLSPVFRHVSDQLTFTFSAGSNYGYNDYLRLLHTDNHTVTLNVPDMTSEVHVLVRARAPVATEAIYTDVFNRLG